MKDRRNDWKSQLRDRMEVYGEPEPDGLWESVASSLRQKGVMAGSGVAESASSSGNLLRDRRHLWWYVVPALAMAAVCVGLLLPFSGGESQVTVVPGNEHVLPIRVPELIDAAVFDIIGANGPEA